MRKKLQEENARQAAGLAAKKRGRPKGSKNKTAKTKRVKAVEEQPLHIKPLTQGQFKFTSELCDCVHYSDVMGCGMFCIHKNPLMARKT